MGMEVDAAEVAQTLNWAEATQGDILKLDSLWYASGPNGEMVEHPTPDGVVLLSQTCDLVRGRDEDRILVAPVQRPSKQEQSAVRKGRKPMLVLVGSARDRVAEMGRVVSLPRAMLHDCALIERTCSQQSGRDAAELASRITRALGRFAFPDGVHESLRRFQRKILDSYDKSTKFARALHVVDEFRLECSDWSSDHKELTLYAIVDAECLPAADLKSSGWEWGVESVAGLKVQERPEQLALERISELIEVNAQARNDSALVELWRLWQDIIQRDLLSAPVEDVELIDFVVVSGDDLRYSDYLKTQPLDFSTLSHT